MMRDDDSLSKLPDSLWAASASDAPETSVLQGEHSCPVVVIGGGFTGLSTALHLAENNQEVMVLESEAIGFGGSGRNVGLVNAGLWLKPEEVEDRLGKDHGKRLNSVLAEAPGQVFSIIERYGIDCEATQNGTLHLSHSFLGDKNLKERLHQLQERGAPVELLSPEKTAHLTGTHSYRTSIFDPRAGTIQPLSYVRGLAKAACSLGAQIYTNSQVTELSSLPSGEWKVCTEQGSVIAEKVVIATNAYSESLYSQLKYTFVPVHFFQYATKPLDPETLKTILPGKQGCWDTRDVMSSLRLDQSGRLILGSVGEVTDKSNSFLKSWASDRLPKLFPDQFSKSEIQKDDSFWSYGWSGKIAYSNNNIPHLHPLAPGVIACVGYSGRGIGPGTVMGKLLAEYIQGKPLEDLPLPLTQPEPILARYTREQYYARGSDLYHLYQRVV